MNAPGQPSRGGLVGRHREVAALDEFLDAAREGPCALLLRGPAGIGKTALWRRGVEEARARGALVLVARPAEDERLLAFGGIVDLFEFADPPLAPEATADPFAVGRALLARVREHAARAPVVLAIDDLPFLDARSGQALRYALRRVRDEPIGLLGSARTGRSEAATGLEPALVREIELAPLTLEEVRSVLDGVVSAISRPALRRIHEVSGGNPLYAIELARGLGAIGVEDGHLPLPDSLQGAIERRLEMVRGDVLAVLEIVSAVGVSSLCEVQAVLPERDVDAALAEAERLSLLAVESARSIRFAHPLVGSVVYERQSWRGRRDLHERLARATSDPDLRAHHLARSTEGPDEIAAAELEAAAARAAERGRFDVAAELARHCRRLTPPVEEAAFLRRSLAAIAATADAGELRRSRELADELVAALPPGRARAEAIFCRAHNETDDCATAEAYLTQALAEVGDDDVLRGWLLEILSWQQALHRGDLAAGLQSAREALAIGGDPTFEMHARASLGHLSNLAGTAERAALERAYELWRARATTMWTGPRPYIAEYRLWCGDLAGARVMLEDVVSELGRYGSESDRPYHLYDLVVLRCAAGEFHEADAVAAQASQAARDAEDDWATLILDYPLALVAAWLGRGEEARERAGARLAEALRRGEQPAAARVETLLGLLALSAADVDGAMTHLGAAVAIFDRTGYRHHAALPCVPEAIEAFAKGGEHGIAQTLVDRLAADAIALRSPWVDAALERAQGHVLLARGDAEAAERALAAATAGFAGLGFQPDAARARLAHGQASIRAGHRTRAADELTAAHAAFEAMGAVRFAERAAEELARVAPGRAEGELTATERQVARLVAEGLRNREIAARLYMAVATVEAHLTRIYRKLGIRSRADLARLVVEDDALIRDATVAPTP